jgi:hypothetical protein
MLYLPLPYCKRQMMPISGIHQEMQTAYIQLDKLKLISPNIKLGQAKLPVSLTNGKTDPLAEKTSNFISEDSPSATISISS